MEGQERDDGTVEIFDVLGLDLITASGVGIFAFRVALGGSLGFEFGPNLVDGACRCPYAASENLPALLLLDDPMIPSGLHPAGQGGVSWQKQHPTFRCRQDFSI